MNNLIAYSGNPPLPIGSRSSKQPRLEVSTVSYVIPCIVYLVSS